MTDALAKWRAAHAAVEDAQAKSNAAWANVLALGKAAALVLMSPKARKVHEATELPPWDLRTSHTLLLEWEAAVPKKRRAELHAEWVRIREETKDAGLAADAHLDASVKARNEAAAEIAEPVVGEGAKWRAVETVWMSTYNNQTDPVGYARARAVLRYRDLETIGYEVRLIARKPKPYVPGPLSFRCPHMFERFEVWARTCDEGRRVIDYQYPTKTLAQALNDAADEGVNPVALYGNLVPVAVAEAAGAFNCRYQHRKPPPVLVVEHDAPWPAVDEVGQDIATWSTHGKDT